MMGHRYDLYNVLILKHDHVRLKPVVQILIRWLPLRYVFMRLLYLKIKTLDRKSVV